MNYTQFKFYFFPILIISCIILCSCKKIYDPAEPYRNKIVFITSEQNNFYPDIFIMDISGGYKINLTNSPDGYEYPTFSHDGSKILFVNGRNLYTMYHDGTNIKNINLDSILFQYIDPSFSPDDSKVLFSGLIYDGGHSYYGAGIYIVNIDGSNLTKIVENIPESFIVKGSEPQFLPDGRRIIFRVFHSIENRHHIYIMNLDGTNQINLTPSSQSQLGLLRLSPDGTKIAFVKSVNDSLHLRTMNIDGTENKLIECVGIYDILGLFEFSPDGNTLLYKVHLANRKKTQLCTIDINGTNKKILLNSDFGLLINAMYSPNGEKIVYEHYYSIYVIDSDGKNKKNLTEKFGMASDPDISPITY